MMAWRLALASFLGPRVCWALSAGNVDDRALDMLSWTCCCATAGSLRGVLGLKPPFGTKFYRTGFSPG